MEPVLILSALALGALLAVQAGANLQLSAAMGSPFGASTAQLAVGSAVLAALAVAVGSIGAVDRIPDATAWHLVGGLASSLYITAGILLFPRLGALAAVGLFITGQVLASAAVDAFGLLGVERRPLGVVGVVGALVVLAGVLAITRTGAGGVPVPRRRRVDGARPRCRRRARPAGARERRAAPRPGHARDGRARSRSSSPPPRWPSCSPAGRRRPAPRGRARPATPCRGGAGPAGSSARPT